MFRNLWCHQCVKPFLNTFVPTHCLYVLETKQENMAIKKRLKVVFTSYITQKE